MIAMQKMGVELSSDLRKKYGMRSFPLVKGDVVRIKKGSRKGEGGKVVEVDHLKGFVTIDGITVAKSDNKQKAFVLRPEKLVITRLDFSRQDRIERIRSIAALKKIELNEEDLKPEPEPEPEVTPESGEQAEIAGTEAEAIEPGESGETEKADVADQPDQIASEEDKVEEESKPSEVEANDDKQD